MSNRFQNDETVDYDRNEPVPNPIGEPKQQALSYLLPYDAALHGPRDYYDKIRRAHGVGPDEYLASKATSEIGDPSAPPFVGVAIIGAICGFFGFLLGAIIF